MDSYERSRSAEVYRRAGGFLCFQPRVTRGDWGGGAPLRGNAGGAAEKVVEKEGLEQNPSSSAESFFFVYFIGGSASKKKGDERGGIMAGVRIRMG